MKDQEQIAKEEVIEFGINNNLAMFTRGNEIISRAGNGTEKVVSKSASSSTRWQDAQKALIDNNDAKKATKKQGSLKIYTDGGSRGNPGPSASGYVIMNSENEIIEEGGEYLGITTNNQAEYQAVKLALQSAKKYNPAQVHFYIDSLLVVNQMKGIYKIKNRDLWPIHSDIKTLATTFSEVTFTHIRREQNKLADAKVNEVLDSHSS